MITFVSDENPQVTGQTMQAHTTLTAQNVPTTPNVPRFSQCNNAMNNERFKAQGAYLPLPRGYESASQPDWRAVLFSVILPAPAVDSAPAFEWPAGWIPGRFRGVKKVQVPGEKEDGSGYELKYWKNPEGENRVGHMSDWRCRQLPGHTTGVTPEIHLSYIAAYPATMSHTVTPTITTPAAATMSVSGRFAYSLNAEALRNRSDGTM